MSDSNSTIGNLYTPVAYIFTANGLDNYSKPDTGYRVDLTSTLADYYDTTADFGYIKLDGVIGDTVYEDINANGVYDIGVDPLIDNVLVQAYRDENSDGIIDGGDTSLGLQET